MLRKYGIVIFIHGCFWHGHEVDATIPRTNTEFWKKKIEGNRLRDERNKEALKNMGWKIITIWECQLKPAVRERTLLEMEYYINHSFLEHFKQKPVKPSRTEENEKAPGLVAKDEAEYRKKQSHVNK